jgi:hypothetical protein
MAYNMARTGAQVKAVLDAAVLPGEPNGFVDRAASTVTWDAATRTMTIAPVGAEFAAWVNGVQLIIDAPQSVVWDDVEGAKLFAFAAETNQLTVINAFDAALIGSDAFIAYGYWDATNKELLLDALVDERHGYQMPAAVHAYLHSYEGARYGGGLDLVLGGVDENGNEDAHAQFTLTAGTISDEDLPHTIAAKAALSDGFRVLYQEGLAGTWRQSALTSFPVVLAEGVPQYNQLVDVFYQLSPVPNNDFVFAHIGVTGALGGAPQWFAILGQAVYSSAGNARAAAAAELARLNLDGLPGPEMPILYSVLLQYQSGDANGASAHFVSLDDGDFIDHRAAKGAAGASATALPGLAASARATAVIAGGAVGFTLASTAYTCQLTENAAPTVVLPPGGNAEDFQYRCAIDFLPPDAGGPFALSIPAGWLQAGPLAAIALSAGDAPIRCVLETLADGTIAYDAVQTVVA